MPSTAAATIIAALPHLPASDLAQVENHCKALRAFSNGRGAEPDAAPTDNDSEMLLGAICQQLRRLGAEYVSVPILRKAANAAFRAKAAAVMDYIRHGGVGTRIEQAAVLAIAVELLYENMTQIGVMVSSRTLLTHAHRLPAALNRAFPGYAQSGILNWIVQRHR